MFLTRDQMITLTGRKRATAQIRVLKKNGIPYKTDVRGFPVVAVSYFNPLAAVEYRQDVACAIKVEPNFDALMTA